MLKTATFKLQLKDELDPNTPVEGVIIEKKKKTLYIDLSPFGLGIVRGINYLQQKDFIKTLNEGDKVLCRVIERDTEEGLIELALHNMGGQKEWQNLQKIKEENKSFPLQILAANSGGLIGKLENIQGFLPVSQLSSEHYPRVEGGNKEKILEKLKSFVGKTLEVKILDLDASTNKLIFSEKLVEKEKIAQILSRFKPGDIVKARITKIVDFGAFARIEELPLPVDALIHISEIPLQNTEEEGKIISPREKIKQVIKEGEVKKARITTIKDSRVTLSLKGIKNDSK